MFRFSANLGFLWPELPLLERIAAASRAGFRAVEMHCPYDVPAERIRAACASVGVRLLGINTAVGEGAEGHRGLGAVPGCEAEFQAIADQAIAYCHAAGGTSVHAMAGQVAEADCDAATEVFVRNLKAAAGKAAERGITLLLEPLNRRDFPGYFYSTLEPAIAIIDGVGAPNLKLMFDVYHVAVSEGDVMARLKTHFTWIGHVQIAAVPTRAEPDEGEIDYRAVFNALEALGYDGWIGCEYKPRADTESGLGWVNALGVRL